MENYHERRLPVYKLHNHKKTLKYLKSFVTIVDRVNFITQSGWGPIVGGKGRTYVTDDGHGVPDYKPELRGVDLLDVFYLKLTDMVVLTEEQYSDYCAIAGLN